MASRHTPVHQLIDWAERTPSATALRAGTVRGPAQFFTWAQYYEAVRKVAGGLLAWLKLKTGRKPKPEQKGR